MDGTRECSNWRLLGAVWWKQSLGKLTGGDRCQDVSSVRLPFEIQVYEPLTNSDSAWRRTVVPLAFLPLLNPRDLAESTKSILESEERKYPAVFLSQMCAIFGALWFWLNSKWKQCCFFSFAPPPRSKTACQTTFLSIISDMRGLLQTFVMPLACGAWPSLGQFIGCRWPQWTVCYPHAKRC